MQQKRFTFGLSKAELAKHRLEVGRQIMAAMARADIEEAVEEMTPEERKEYSRWIRQKYPELVTNALSKAARRSEAAA